MNLKNTKALQSIWPTHQCGVAITNPISNDYFLKAWWNMLLLRPTLECSIWIWRNKLKQIMNDLTKQKDILYELLFSDNVPKNVHLPSCLLTRMGRWVTIKADLHTAGTHQIHNKNNVSIRHFVLQYCNNPSQQHDINISIKQKHIYIKCKWKLKRMWFDVPW